jgi:hypothetical protein
MLPAFKHRLTLTCSILSARWLVVMLGDGCGKGRSKTGKEERFAARGSRGGRAKLAIDEVA